MPKLFKLLYGKSKKRLKPVMIDTLDKVNRYSNELQVTAENGGKTRWTKIVPADPGENVWRRSNKNQWTNYNVPGPKIV